MLLIPFQFSYLPVETWTEILSFISRIKLAKNVFNQGDGVSLTNWLFNEISRKRIDEYYKHIVPSLVCIISIFFNYFSLLVFLKWWKWNCQIAMFESCLSKIEIANSNCTSSPANQCYRFWTIRILVCH